MNKSLVSSDELREITDEELDVVAGGLNPQPLPPRYSFGSFQSLTSQFKTFSLASRGIIIVGG